MEKKTVHEEYALRKIRHAPLVNILYGLAALGEGVYRGIIGDIKGMEDSCEIIAASALLSGLLPYGLTITGLDENLSSSGSNAILGGIVYYGNYIRPSTSITYNLFPYFAGAQVITNLIEYYTRKFSRFTRKKKLSDEIIE